MFFQDNLKLTQRLTLNLGVRYEYFGVPQPRGGSRDFNFLFGSGASLGERITTGRLAAVQLLLAKPDANGRHVVPLTRSDLYGETRHGGPGAIT